MAVQIVENWSKIFGIVQSVQPSPEVDEFMAVEVDVRAVEPVEGFPNLLKDTAGKCLVIHIPKTLVQELSVAALDWIECRVRQAGPDRYFVHRDYITVTHPDV